MKYHILFIYFFLLSLGAYGQSAQKIPTFIDLENINDISSDEKRLVKKSLYEALLSGKNFDLNINGSIPVADKEKKDWLIIKVKVNKEELGYSAELALESLLQKKILNRVGQDKIARNKLQLTLRQMIYKVLYGERFDVETNSLKNDEPIAAIANLNNNKAPDIDPDVDDPDDVVPDLDEEREQALDKDSDDKPQIAEQKKKKSTSKKPEIKIRDFDSPNIDLSREPVEKGDEPQRLPPWVKTFDIEAGLVLEGITSRVVVDASEKNALLKIGGEYLFSSPSQVSYFKAKGSFDKIFTEDEFQKPINFELGIRRHLHLFWRKVFLFGGAHFETENFINVNEQGAGQQLWSNQIMWYEFGMNIFYQLFNRTHEIEYSAKSILAGVTDLSINGQEVSITGTRLDINLVFQIKKKYHLKLGYNTQALQSQTTDFEYTQSQILVGLLYR